MLRVCQAVQEAKAQLAVEEKRIVEVQAKFDALREASHLDKQQRTKTAGGACAMEVDSADESDHGVSLETETPESWKTYTLRMFRRRETYALQNRYITVTDHYTTNMLHIQAGERGWTPSCRSY